MFQVLPFICFFCKKLKSRSRPAMPRTIWRNATLHYFSDRVTHARSSTVKFFPVQTLQNYIENTASCRPADHALFLLARHLFIALESSSVVRVLEETIAGLGCQSFQQSLFVLPVLLLPLKKVQIQQ